MLKKITFQRIKEFFKETKQEIKKVDWPSREETIRYTLIVIGASFVVATILGFLDFIYFKLLKKFIF